MIFIPTGVISLITALVGVLVDEVREIRRRRQLEREKAKLNAERKAARRKAENTLKQIQKEREAAAKKYKAEMLKEIQKDKREIPGNPY